MSSNCMTDPILNNELNHEDLCNQWRNQQTCIADDKELKQESCDFNMIFGDASL